MAKNIILRPVFNRPEMFYLSLEYEIKAREYFMLEGEFTTVFMVEYGAPPKIFDLISSYPYHSVMIRRKKKLGLTVNILEGMRKCFDLANDYIVYIEDDVLLHKHYMRYMSVLLNMVDKFSVLSPYNSSDGGNINEVYKAHHYAALAPLISKDFYLEYVQPHSNKHYYTNPAKYVINLGVKYKEYWGKLYKYRDTSTHYEQAGLHNRAVDIAAIENDVWVYMPRINRQQHIGFYGKNRPGGIIPGNSFEERLDNLREIIISSDKMYKLTSTKCYNDYKVFSPKLDEWDGSLEIRGN